MGATRPSTVLYTYTTIETLLSGLSLPSKDKKDLRNEFDYAAEIGADELSLVRAMYVGQLVSNRLYL